MCDLGNDVAGDRLLRCGEFERGDRTRRFFHGLRDEVGDLSAADLHGAGDSIEPCSVAGRAGLGFSAFEGFALAFHIKLLFESGFEAGIDALFPYFAEASALGAPAVRGVEGKHSGVEFFKAHAAFGASAFGAQNGAFVLRIHDADGAFSDGQRGFYERVAIAAACLADEDFDGVLDEPFELHRGVHFPQFTVHEQRGELMALGPFCDIGVKAFARFHEGGEKAELPAFAKCFDFAGDGVGRLFFDRAVAVGAVLRAEFGKQEPQEMIDFGDGGDGAFSPAASDALLDGNARRKSGDEVNVWLLELLHKLSRVRRHDIQEPPLAFGKENVEGECAFARTGKACDDD